MNVNEILNSVNYFANKEQTGLTMTPLQYNNLLPIAQIEFIKKRIGLPEQYGANNKGQISYESTMKVSDDLHTLKKEAILTVNNSGEANRPVDVFYPISFRFLYDKMFCGSIQKIEAPIEIVDEDEWGIRLSSDIKSPSKIFPICKINSSTMTFAPYDLGSVKFVYLKNPIKPIFNYTVDGNGIIQYSSLGSVQLELPENVHIDVVRILLSYVGINIREPELQIYAETKIQKGI